MAGKPSETPKWQLMWENVDVHIRVTPCSCPCGLQGRHNLMTPVTGYSSTLHPRCANHVVPHAIPKLPGPNSHSILLPPEAC